MQSELFTNNNNISSKDRSTCSRSKINPEKKNSVLCVGVLIAQTKIMGYPPSRDLDIRGKSTKEAILENKYTKRTLANCSLFQRTAFLCMK